MNNKETSTDVVFEYTGDRCYVPKDVISVRVIEGLKKIGDSAFYDRSSLESITLPSTLTEIGNHAFFGTNLREVTLNDGLKKIGIWAFCKCTSLESITLPSTLTEIDNYAFGGCSNLIVVTLNEGLKKIRNAAFHNCKSLESIKLPSSIVEIGAGAFNYCGNLREVELDGVPQSFKIESFRNCDSLERFLFPTMSYRLENIIKTGHWNELEDKLNEVRGVLQWESDKLFVSRATNQSWNETKRDLDRITRLVSYYEVKEATSTFELALWKSKLDQADATNTTNRAAYRIDVPGPVKDTMLQYLDHTC